MSVPEAEARRHTNCGRGLVDGSEVVIDERGLPWWWADIDLEAAAPEGPAGLRQAVTADE